MLLGVLVVATACSVPSAEDLAVSPSIADANLTLTKGPLEAHADGSMIVVLTLGPSASDASDVTIQPFSLVRQLDGSVLTQLATYGVTQKRVGVGVTEKIEHKIDSAVAAGAAAAICAAGPVKVVGSIEDGARHRVTSMESAVFTVVCK